jgi:ABC-type lipoprotein export system ATPase subunit
MVKIRKIRITNYRSCIDTTFAPNESLSVLIGPNGSGKTNVLSAMRLLPQLGHHGPGRYRREPSPDSSIPKATITTQYDVDGVVVNHVASLLLVTNERNLDEIVDADEYWQIPSRSQRKRIVVPSWAIIDVLDEGRSIHGRRLVPNFLMQNLKNIGLTPKSLETLVEVVRFNKGISYYGASQFTNPSQSPLSFDVELEATRVPSLAPTGHKKLLYDMYQAHVAQSDSYSEFLDIVGPNGIGLVSAVNFQEIPTLSSNYSVFTGGRIVEKRKTNKLIVPSFNIAGNSLSPNQLSEGTFKALALIFYLVTDKSSLLMIEEPEVCVHHGLLNSIMELIRIYSSEKQVFVSTHAESVLDKVDIPNVFRVSRAESGTQVSGLKGNVKGRALRALRNYLENEGSLGEYWKHGDLEDV